jgi:hypothetical protein
MMSAVRFACILHEELAGVKHTISAKPELIRRCCLSCWDCQCCAHSDNGIANLPSNSCGCKSIPHLWCVGSGSALPQWQVVLQRVCVGDVIAQARAMDDDAAAMLCSVAHLHTTLWMCRQIQACTAASLV